MKPRYQYLIVFLVSLAFFAYYQFQATWLPDTDGYYHIKTAWLLRTHGFMRNFKWADQSLWRDHYSDKEFLYHVFLIPFTFFNNLVLGAKLATIFVASCVFVSFFAVLKLNNIKWPWLWLFMLSAAGGYFLYRVNVPRPQGVSIIYVIWSIHFLLNRRLLPLAILCFLYTFSYTAYHLPFIFACIIFFEGLILEKTNDWKLPAIVLGATLGGMCLSPFFPDNFRMFYLQNFFILWQGAGSSVNLRMGGEFGPFDTKAILVNTTAVLAFLAAFFMTLYKPLPRDKKLRQLFLIALSMIFLNCFSKRFAEYSVPVTLLFAGFFFSPYLERFSLKELSKKKKAGIIAGAVLSGIALSIGSWASTYYDFKGITEPGLKPAAEWLKEHTKDDELVFTADWDDAPELFYFNHKDRYYVFLDPNFMYCWDKDRWREWDDLTAGRLGATTYDHLKMSFKVHYGVATNDFNDLYAIIKGDNRMKIVFEGGNGFVFEVK